MVDRSSSRRRIPLAALTTLGLLLAVGLPRSAAEEKVSAEKAPTTQRAGDIKDTHQRLDRIYERLGIKRKEAATPPPERRGCDCKRGSDSDKPLSSPLTPTAPPALPPMLGYILIGVVLVAMLLPILFALRGRRRDVPRSSDVVVDDEEGAVAPDHVAWDVDLSACRRLLTEGRLAEAFAGLHRVTLLTLERVEALHLDNTSTNWDYVRRLSGRPTQRALLSAVTIAAESAVLGKQPPNAARYEQLETALRQQMEAL